MRFLPTLPIALLAGTFVLAAPVATSARLSPDHHAAENNLLVGRFAAPRLLSGLHRNSDHTNPLLQAPRRAIRSRAPIEMPFRNLPSFREIRIGKAHHHKKWQVAANQYESDYSSLQSCLFSEDLCRSPTVKRWAKLVAKSDASSVHEKIHKINVGINRATSYRYDMRDRQFSDNWSAPLHFLQHGGDCEDYALAKYWSLRALGMPADAMRLVVAYNIYRNTYHAVLVVAVNDSFVVLDNNYDRVGRLSEYSHFNFQYALNEKSKWMFVRSTNQTIAASTKPKSPTTKSAGNSSNLKLRPRIPASTKMVTKSKQRATVQALCDHAMCRPGSSLTQ